MKTKKKFGKSLAIILIVLVLGSLVALFVYNKQPVTLENVGEKSFRISQPGKAEDTVWKINGTVCEVGKNSVKLDKSFLKMGKNVLVAKNGDYTKTFEFELKDDGSKAAKTVSLLQPLTEEETERLKSEQDSDNDGVTDVDEIEKYGTNPYKAVSNEDGVSDMLTAAVKDYNVEIDDDGEYVFENYIPDEGKNTNLISLTAITKGKNCLDPVIQRTECDTINVCNSKGCKTAVEIDYLYDKPDKDEEEKVCELYEIFKDGTEPKKVKGKVTSETTTEFPISHDGTYRWMYLEKTKTEDADYFDKISSNEVMFVVDNSGSMFTNEYVNESIDPEDRSSLALKWPFVDGYRDLGEDDEVEPEPPTNVEIMYPGASFIYPDCPPPTESLIGMSAKPSVEHFSIQPLKAYKQSPSRSLIELPKVAKKGENGSVYNEDNESSLYPVFSYANDVDFKRVTLAQSVIDEVEKEQAKYKYGAMVFNDEINVLSELTYDAEAVSSSLNRVRDEFQVFEGSAVSSAAKEAIPLYTKDTLGKKTMVIFTDGGESSYLFGNHSSSLSSLVAYDLKNNNINLILVGLGDCDREYLKDFAKNANGLFLYADDENVVEDIKRSLLEPVLEDGSTVIADSGFRPQKDGFPFTNFSSISSPGGNCYGFSLASKMIYENINKSNLFASFNEAKMPIVFTTSSLRGKSLNFGISKENSEKMQRGNTSNLTSETADFYDSLRGQIYIDDGCVKYKGGNKVVEFPDLISVTKNDNGVSVFIDPFTNMPETQEAAVLRYICASQLMQFQILLTDTQFEEEIGEETFNQSIVPAMNNLKVGKPVMLSLFSSGGGHSILLYKIAQDEKNPTKFYLYTYDSNEPCKEQVAIVTYKNRVRDGDVEPCVSFEYEGGGWEFREMSIANVTKFVTYNPDVMWYEDRF